MKFERKNNQDIGEINSGLRPITCRHCNEVLLNRASEGGKLTLLGDCTDLYGTAQAGIYVCKGLALAEWEDEMNACPGT